MINDNIHVKFIRIIHITNTHKMKDLKYNEHIHNDYNVLPDTMYTFNAENIADFSFKTDENFRRHKDSNLIFDKILFSVFFRILSIVLSNAELDANGCH